MTVRKARKPRPPLDRAALNELALSYAGRFATTRAKLRLYLKRKVRERGWDGGQPPDFEGIAEEFARRGYVDDAAYALAKSRALTGRGYGGRRVDQSLRSAGVDDSDAEAARELAREDSLASALRFAERRRIGPYAAETPDPKGRERALAAMIRAGHNFAVARAIVHMAPGDATDVEALGEALGQALS